MTAGKAVPSTYAFVAAFLMACLMLCGIVGCRQADNAGASSATSVSSSVQEAEASSMASPGEAPDAEAASSSADSGEGGASSGRQSLEEATQMAVEAAPATMDATPSPNWVVALPEAARANQLFIVAVDGTSSAQTSMHQKADDGTWQQIMASPGYIGREGLGKAQEGDELTPQGTFIFDRAFGIAPDPGCSMIYTQVGDDVYWSGDWREGMHYNQMVSILDVPGLDTSVSEHLVDYVPEYEYCLNISFNNACTPGEGSAIFLHCTGEHPYTGGCVAIPLEQMKFVMQHVKPRCTVVIDTAANLGAG